MNAHKFSDRKKTDLSNEVARILDDVKKFHVHKADGTTVEEVVSALQEVESVIKQRDFEDKTMITELSKLDFEELRRKRDFLITQTRSLLRDIYVLSSQIRKNVRLIKMINRILEKKLLEKRSSEL